MPIFALLNITPPVEALKSHNSENTIFGMWNKKVFILICQGYIDPTERFIHNAEFYTNIVLIEKALHNNEVLHMEISNLQKTSKKMFQTCPNFQSHSYSKG